MHLFLVIALFFFTCIDYDNGKAEHELKLVLRQISGRRTWMASSTWETPVTCSDTRNSSQAVSHSVHPLLNLYQLHGL